MPNSAAPVTPGAGLNIAVNPVASLDYQVVKLDAGADGASYPLIGDGTHGLPVDVSRIQGNVTVAPQAGQTFPISAAAPLPISASSPIPVSALANAPVFVRLSDGTNPVATLPVTGTVAVTQSTPASASAPWPISLTDGSHGVAEISAIGGHNALSVSVLSGPQVNVQADKSAFTEGSMLVGVVAGEYNDAASQPSAGQVAAVRITQPRALHVNLRTAAGVEVGTSSAPVRTDPTGTTIQPVSGTVTANQGAPPWSQNVTQVAGHAVVEAAAGIPRVGIADGAGNAYSDSNPLPVTSVPNGATFWSAHVAFTASQTAQPIRAATTGKIFYVDHLLIAVTGSGPLTVFDETDSATSELFNGTVPIGVLPIPFNPPRPASAVTHTLKYTTGTGAVGDIVAKGYEV